ncbi:PPC domain-containing DNA-binding protein [Nocardia brasiliensis]|uniref:PPC domain-containing DNA-binding protein n=1 Tax=Nocardia brasiliensis TaxID=37326 RepID=UPI0024538A74|nr:DNA-binding protein [Nocardia brasiliensis]
MKAHVLQLRAGADILISLDEYVRENDIGAGYLLTCVSGLSEAVLRMPGTKESQTLTGDMKIVTAQGTVSPDGCRIHFAVADLTGAVTGGQLVQGCIVRMTAEIVIIEDETRRFTRESDADTGHKELVIHPVR